MVRGIDSIPPEKVSIAGPAGELVGTLESPLSDVEAAVLLLHPHPLHGGNRRNNVVRHGALGALEAKCSALRLDLRGAGDSGGAHDEGAGELEDVDVALSWLGERFPASPCFIWGFSFGARVGLDFRLSRPGRSAGFLGVGWPNAIHSWPKEKDWPRPMAFLAGEKDEFVDQGGMSRVSDEGADFVSVSGAGHFFRGNLFQVRDFTRGHLSKWLA